MNEKTCVIVHMKSFFTIDGRSLQCQHSKRSKRIFDFVFINMSKGICIRKPIQRFVKKKKKAKRICLDMNEDLFIHNLLFFSIRPPDQSHSGTGAGLDFTQRSS